MHELIVSAAVTFVTSTLGQTVGNGVYDGLVIIYNGYVNYKNNNKDRKKKKESWLSRIFSRNDNQRKAA